MADVAKTLLKSAESERLDVSNYIQERVYDLLGNYSPLPFAKDKAIRAFSRWLDPLEKQVNIQLVNSQQVLLQWDELETRLRDLRLGLNNHREADKNTKFEVPGRLDIDRLLGRNSLAFRLMDNRLREVEASYGYIGPAREYLQVTGVQLKSICEALPRIRASVTSFVVRGSRATFDFKLAVSHISESYTKLSETEKLIKEWFDKEMEARARSKKSNGAKVYDYTNIFEAGFFSDEP